jgi:cytochrome P450
MSEHDEAVGIFASMLTEKVAEPQPMCRSLLDGGPVLQVTDTVVVAMSRAAVEEVLRNPDVFSSGQSATDLKARRPIIPMSIDPPAHRTYRKLLDPLFSPQRMKLLEGPMTALANELIDAFVGDDEVDFTAAFSIPFPCRVFLTMFGLPVEELPTFLQMKDGIIRPFLVTGEPRGSEATDAYQQATADSIYEYFERLLDERGSKRGDDMLSHLLDAEVDGDRLTREEVVDIGFQFLIAGLDTVTATLDCVFGYLAQHPDQRKTLVADPDGIPNAVEELLRWESPVFAAERVATRDAELAGCPVHAGDHVLTLIGAANIDDAELPEAGEAQLDRQVTRHLAFGGGIHRCLGSHLARLELKVALREWHRRIPEYSLKPGATLGYSPGIRALDTFPMVLGRS